MKSVLLVFLGGGLGSAFRYLVSRALNDQFSQFFLGTFLANVIGCLLIGFLMGLSQRNEIISANHTLLLVTGFCGGFTTFSTFAFENYGLLQEGFSLHFSIYTLFSIIIGLLAVMLGLWCAKLV